MRASEFYEKLSPHGHIGVIRCKDTDKARQAALTSAQAGLTFIEITYTVESAAQLIQDLKTELPDSFVGAGTIVSQAQLNEAHKAGADFLVSPHFDPQLCRQANHLGISYSPGCLTPSELVQAAELLEEKSILKLFPGSVFGVSGVRAILNALPSIPLMVSGGVTKDNQASFFEAGAVAICAASQLFSSQILENEDWPTLKIEVESWLKTTQSSR